MIKREWQKLLKNKVLIVVLIAIITIPTIYTTLFLGSMWDPYGEVNHLPVAVVNHDKAVIYNDEELNVGKDLVDNLKENDSLAFNFVDSETAKYGLENGTYYMVITIPEKFSENASTLLDDKPVKMELQYETNPGTNYIACKMSETALTKVKDSISAEVTKTYAQTMFDQIKEVGDGMQEAADGSDTLREGIQKLSDGNTALTDNLQVLSESTLTFREGSNTLNEGLDQYVKGVSDLSNGAKRLVDGSSALADGTKTLKDGTNTLNSGMSELADGTAKLNTNAGILINGVSSLMEGADQLDSGAGQVAAGASQYVAGTNTFIDGTASYAAGVAKLADGIGQLKGLQELGQVSDGIEQLNLAVSADGSQSLKTGSAKLTEGILTIKTQVDMLKDSASAQKLQTLMEGLTEAKNGMTMAGQGMTDAGQTIHAASAGISSAEQVMQEGLLMVNQQVEANNQVIGTFRLQIDQANQQINQANDSIQTGADTINTQIDQAICLIQHAKEAGSVDGDTADAVIAGLQGSKVSVERADTVNVSVVSMQEVLLPAEVEQTVNTVNKKLQAAAEGLSAGAAVMADSAAAMGAAAEQIPAVSSGTDNDLLTALSNSLGEAYQGAQQVQGGVLQVSGALNELQAGTASFDEAAIGIKALVDGADQLMENNAVLDAGGKQLKASGNSLTEGAVQVKEGTSTLVNKGGELADGANQFAQGISSANDGAQKLKSGVSELAGGISTLSSGVTQAQDGLKTLYGGSTQLVANSPALLEGGSRLSSAAGQISDGAGQLADGSVTLGSGLKDAFDGLDTLTDSLEDASKQVKEVKSNDGTIDMFAVPVEARETQITTVENNGHAMAAYMMSVALWVGCIAFCIMYPLTQYSGKLKSGFSWWLSKATVVYPIAVIMALVMLGMLHLINGFNPTEWAGTIIVACLAGAAFMSIMYFFNVALGKVGSFIMLIFMVIQLAGSAGTYPIELSGKFVSGLHKWMPFSYTVDAFRSTISGGNNIMNAVLVLTGLLVVFTLLTIWLFQIRTRKIMAGKSNLYDFLEEEGLA